MVRKKNVIDETKSIVLSRPDSKTKSIFTFLDQYRQSQYVVGSRHLNGANYIADFERQTSYCSLDPVTLSFPSNNNSLYDSITMTSNNTKNKNYNDNIKASCAQSNCKVDVPTPKIAFSNQEHLQKKERHTKDYHHKQYHH